jgi:hypothetical protein
MLDIDPYDPIDPYQEDLATPDFIHKIPIVIHKVIHKDLTDYLSRHSISGA